MCFQGDKEAELGLPFSPLCDRKSTMVAQSQIGECFLIDQFLIVTAPEDKMTFFVQHFRKYDWFFSLNLSNVYLDFKSVAELSLSKTSTASSKNLQLLRSL